MVPHEINEPGSYFKLRVLSAQTLVVFYARYLMIYCEHVYVGLSYSYLVMFVT